MKLVRNNCLGENNINPEERFAEIAEIIIKGIKRLKAKEQKQKLEELLKTNNITTETLNDFIKQDSKGLEDKS